MPITSGNPGSVVNVFSSGAFTGTLPVTSTLAEPVWVTGTVTAAVTIPPVTVTENSVGVTGSPPPVSATFVGGMDATGNLSPLKIDASGNLYVAISGSVVSSGSTTVTSSQANPVWITGTATVTATLTGAMSVVDPGNSTTGLLASGGMFVGTSVDTLGYASIGYTIYTDQLSATPSGVQVQFSNDDVIWDTYWARTVPASNLNKYTDLVFRPHSRYFRIIYINGATPQTTMSLQTTLNKFPAVADTVGVDKAPVPGQDAQLVKAVLAGKNSSGSYIDVQVDDSGTIAIHGIRTPSDNYSNPTNAVNTIGLNMVWDEDTQVWVRVGKGDIDADADVINNVGLTKAESYGKVFNGINFDRQRGDVTGTWVKITDAVPLTATMQMTSSLPVTGTVTISLTSSIPVTWPAGTGAISGTVTAEQTGAFVVTGSITVNGEDANGYVQVVIRSGTSIATVGAPSSQEAGANVQAVAGLVAEYQTSLPTNTANRLAWLEVDQNGRLIATLSGTVVAVSQTNAASQNGLVGVTGAVEVTNTTGTLNVAQTGAFVITGSVTTTPSAPVVVSQGLSSVGGRVWDVQLVDPILSSALRPLAWDANVPNYAIQVSPAVATSSLAATAIAENRLTGLRVDLQGRQYVTLSGTTVAVSQTNPVALTGVSVNGLVGVSGTVAITSGVLTSITNAVVVTSTNVNPVWTTGTTTVTGALTASVALTGALPVTGLVGVSGAVAITSGVLTSITNNVHVDGLVGVSGTVAITSGVLTSITNNVHTDGLHGVTGTVAISSGVLTSITNPVTVTSAFASPVYVSSTITNPVMVSGVVTVNTTGALTVSQSNTPAGTQIVTSTLANPVWISSTIANPVVVTASQANPVTVATTGSWPVTGTVTISITSSLPVVWPAGTGAVSGTVTAEQTGAFVVTGSATVAQTGTWVVSATNPVLAPKVEQTGAFVITGTVTQNVPAFPSVSSTISAAGQTVTLPLGTAIGVAIRISGSYTGTLKFYASFNDGNTYHRVEGYSPEVGDELVTSGPTDVNGIWQPYDIAGATHIRVSSTLWTAGNASVEIYTNNKSAAPMFFTRENGDVTPSYGVQIAGDDAGTFRYIKVDQSGALYVSASQNRPVWVTGSITSEFSASGTFTAVENSVGGDGGVAPVSATLVGGHVTGNLQSINVTANGTVVITGNMEAHQSAAFVVTATQANPVWITGSISTTAGTQVVTSTLTNPVWVTSTNPITATFTGTVPVFLTGATVNQTGAWSVALTGGIPGTTIVQLSGVTVNQTGAWIVSSTIANPVNVTASQASPVTVAVTGAWPVTGTVTIGLTSSFPVSLTGVTVNQTAAWQVAGAVTANAQGLVGVTGAVAVTSGTITGITNVVVVTGALATPVWVAISGNMSASFTGVMSASMTGVTVNQTATWQVALTGATVNGLVGVSGAVAVTSGVLTSITNPVVITATVAAPAYVTSTITSPVNVTASSGNPVSVTIVGGSSAGKQYLTGTDLNGGTGTLLIGVDAGNVARAALMTTAGVLAVSQTNAGTSGGGTQYGTGSAPANMTGTVALANSDGTVVALTATALGVQYVTISGAIDAVFSGTQIVTSTLANSVWVTGTTTVGLTASIPVIITGSTVNQTGSWVVSLSGVTVNQTATWQAALTGVTVNYTASLPVIVTGSSVNGLVGVSGAVAITSGVLTSITNAVTVTSTVGNAVYVTSTQANPITSVGLHGVSGTVAITSGVLTSITNAVVCTSTQANPQWITGTLAGLSGVITAAGTVQATGAQTPSDAFANPTTALLAWALNAQWDGTQWVRQRGGVSGTLVQTKPAATTTVTQVAIAGNSNTTILAANTNRLGASIQSVASAAFAVHVKLGAASALNSYTVRIAQNGYYEVPSNYNGIITGICSGSQAVQVHVTEITQ